MLDMEALLNLPLLTKLGLLLVLLLMLFCIYIFILLGIRNVLVMTKLHLESKDLYISNMPQVVMSLDKEVTLSKETYAFDNSYYHIPSGMVYLVSFKGFKIIKITRLTLKELYETCDLANKNKLALRKDLDEALEEKRLKALARYK